MMDQQSNANTSFSLTINNFGPNEPAKFNTGQFFIHNSGKYSPKSKFKRHSGNYRATNNSYNDKPNKQLEINSDSHKNKNKKRYFNSSDMSLESLKKHKKRKRNKRKNIIIENGPPILQVDTKIKSKAERNWNRNEQHFKPDKAYEKFSIYSGNKFNDSKNMHFSNINFGGEPKHQTHTNHLKFSHKRFKQGVKRPECKSHATVKGEPNINEKEDGDIFYFDICGNRKEFSVSKNIQNNYFKHLVNYDISGNIIENNWDHQPVSINQNEAVRNCSKSEIYTDVLNTINKNKQQPHFDLKFTETNTNKVTLHKKIKKKKKFNNDQTDIKRNTSIYEIYNNVQEEFLIDSVMRTKKPKKKDFSEINHCDKYYKDKDLAPGMSNKDNEMIKKRKRNKNDIAQHNCDGRVSVKKIKKSNADLIQNSESQVTCKMPNQNNDANINTLINVSESECEIINLSDSKQKGIRNKKENVFIVELDTPKKKCKTKNREKSTQENFADDGKNKLNNYFEIEGDGFSNNKSIIVELDTPKKKCKSKNREKTTQENFADDVGKNKLNKYFGIKDDGFSSSKKRKNKHADKVIENSKKLFKPNHINSSQSKEDKSKGKHGTNFSESECEIVGHKSKSSVKKRLSNLDTGLSEKNHNIKTLENYITGDLNNLGKISEQDKEANKCKQKNNPKVHIPVIDKSRSLDSLDNAIKPLFDSKIKNNTEHIKIKNLNSSPSNSADEIEKDGFVQPNLKKRKKSRDENTNFNSTTTKQHKIMNSFPGGSEKENDDKSNTINSIKKSKPDNHSFITDGSTSEAELNLLSKKRSTPNNKKNKSLKTNSDMITEENKTINTLKEKVSKTKNNSVLTTFEDELGDISEIGSEKENHDKSDTKDSLKKCKQDNDHSFVTGGSTSQAELNLSSKKHRTPKKNKKNKSPKTNSYMITEENKTINTLKKELCKIKNNSLLTTFEDEISDISEIITPPTKTGSNTNPDIDTQKGHGKTVNSKGTRQDLNETENGSVKSNHKILNQEEQPQFFHVSKEGVRRTSVFAEFMEMDNDDDNVEDKLLPDLEFCPDPEKIELEHEKLKDLCVRLPFSVPTLHKISTRTTIPTKEQVEKIKNLNLCVKSGPFSKAEDEMIIENWKRLCKEHDLSMIPSIFTKFPRYMKMETKLNILRYLAHGLDDRMINKVYIRFKHLLKKDHLKLGRYTPEEDKTILDFMETTKSVRPFKDLSELLDRTAISIENRYSLLLHSSEKINFSNPEMADRFVKALLKITKCEKLKQLKHREFTTKQWKKLSRKLDNISIKKLQRAWKVTIYPRLFSKKINLREVKEELIHLLYDRKETDWRTVDWMDIATHFRGLTADKLYMMFKHLAYFHVPKAKHNNLGECLDFLENKFLRYNKIPATHKFKKFVMKNGHLRYESDVET